MPFSGVNKKYNPSVAPLPSQVYFHQQQQQTASSENNNYLAISSHHQYSDPNIVNCDQQTDRYNENCYVSHNMSIKDKKDDYLPEGNMTIWMLNDSPVSLVGLCLFNLGSTSALINECAIPPRTSNQDMTKNPGGYLYLRDLFLSELFWCL